MALLDVEMALLDVEMALNRRLSVLLTHRPEEEPGSTNRWYEPPLPLRPEETRSAVKCINVPALISVRTALISVENGVNQRSTHPALSRLPL